MPLKPLHWRCTYRTGECLSESATNFLSLNSSLVTSLFFQGPTGPVGGFRLPSGKFFVGEKEFSLELFGQDLVIPLSGICSAGVDLIQFKEAHQDSKPTKGSFVFSGHAIDSYNIGYKYAGRKINDLEINNTSILSFKEDGVYFSCRVVSTKEAAVALRSPELFSLEEMRIGGTAQTWTIRL